MIEPNAICQEEQEWLRTEQDQQNWLRAEQDQQDCLRAEQEIPLRGSDRGVHLHTARPHYRNAGGLPNGLFKVQESGRTLESRLGEYIEARSAAFIG